MWRGSGRGTDVLARQLTRYLPSEKELEKQEQERQRVEREREARKQSVYAGLDGDGDGESVLASATSTALTSAVCARFGGAAARNRRQQQQIQPQRQQQQQQQQQQQSRRRKGKAQGTAVGRGSRGHGLVRKRKQQEPSERVHVPAPPKRRQYTGSSASSFSSSSSSQSARHGAGGESVTQAEYSRQRAERQHQLLPSAASGPGTLDMPSSVAVGGSAGGIESMPLQELSGNQEMTSAAEREMKQIEYELSLLDDMEGGSSHTALAVIPALPAPTPGSAPAGSSAAAAAAAANAATGSAGGFGSSRGRSNPVGRSKQLKKGEVSDNFVAKDLKRRGTYKPRGGGRGRGRGRGGGGGGGGRAWQKNPRSVSYQLMKREAVENAKSNSARASGLDPLDTCIDRMQLHGEFVTLDDDDSSGSEGSSHNSDDDLLEEGPEDPDEERQSIAVKPDSHISQQTVDELLDVFGSSDDEVDHVAPEEELEQTREAEEEQEQDQDEDEELLLTSDESSDGDDEDDDDTEAPREKSFRTASRGRGRGRCRGGASTTTGAKARTATQKAKAATKKRGRTGAVANVEPPPAAEMEWWGQYGERFRADVCRRHMEQVFGFSSFRWGQEWAVQRVHESKRSLLVLSTGAGKSLCYVLPSLYQRGLTIVVSPLISLMQDQLRNLPSCIPGATLSGSIPQKQLTQTVNDLVNRKIRVLYVSPERLCSVSFRRLVSSGTLPPIELVCVDEAHCLSQWSHNFRPSFLRIRMELDRLRPRSMLALTATASSRVVGDICRHLGIDRDEGVCVGAQHRLNLSLHAEHVATVGEKLDKVADALKTPPLLRGSVIVYVWRRADAELVAAHLLARGVKGGVEPYHAGMGPGVRKRAQRKFLSGTVRVMVATVAFGLGIDKADVRGVIHFTMPKCIEDYVQEIGRAGRDGEDAHCYLFLHDEDLLAQHALTATRATCERQVSEFVRWLVQRGSGSGSDGSEGGVQSASLSVPDKDAQARFRLARSAVETLLTLLEAPDLGAARVVNNVRALCHIEFLRPPQDLKAKDFALAAILGVLDNPMVKHAIQNTCLACDTNEGAGGRAAMAYGFGAMRLPVVETAAALGWSVPDLYRQLCRLKGTGVLRYTLSEDAVQVCVNLQAVQQFRAPAPANSASETDGQDESGSGTLAIVPGTAQGVDALCAELYKRVQDVEHNDVVRLEQAYKVFGLLSHMPTTSQGSVSGSANAKAAGSGTAALDAVEASVQHAALEEVENGGESSLWDDEEWRCAVARHAVWRQLSNSAEQQQQQPPPPHRRADTHHAEHTCVVRAVDAMMNAVQLPFHEPAGWEGAVEHCAHTLLMHDEFRSMSMSDASALPRPLGMDPHTCAMAISCILCGCSGQLLPQWQCVWRDTPFWGRCNTLSLAQVYQAVLRHVRPSNGGGGRGGGGGSVGGPSMASA